MFVCVQKYVKHYENDMILMNLWKTFQHITHLFPMALVIPRNLAHSFPPSRRRVPYFQDEGKNAHLSQ